MFLNLFVLLLQLGRLTHTITVLDATHKKPVAAVVVRTDALMLHTDIFGKVELPVTVGSVTFSRIGYQMLQLTQYQQSTTDTVYLQPVSQALAEVVVRPPGPPHTLTSASNKLTGANPSYPGTQMAIWFNLPDTISAYRLQHINIPVKQKFTAGRISIAVHTKGADGVLLGPSLFPEIIVLTSAAVSEGKHPVVEFDASIYQVMLPPKGFYLVLECLPTLARTENQASARIVSKKGPNKKGVTKGTAFIDSMTEQDGMSTTSSVAVDQYPQFITSPTVGASATWRRFSPQLPFQQLNPTLIGKHKVGSYNIAASVQIVPL